MTRNMLILLASGGSFALLAGAFLFQAAGYAPCEICLWQRWPHAAAIVIGVLAFALAGGARLLAWLGALAAAITAALGLYHTGIERDWWQGPASCTGGGGLSGLSGADLLATDIAPVVMCDEAALLILGLSMASWNFLASGALALIWVLAARRAA
ncbi:MAG: Disulfide bond formation protein DsbB [Rhodobacteraceae bacterium HLUCCA08]|nr:MAG: Disulfide bond formation protein DsbB [Rhodobacteraceae bacterium HLUCCA08]